MEGSSGIFTFFGRSRNRDQGWERPKEYRNNQQCDVCITADDVSVCYFIEFGPSHRYGDIGRSDSSNSIVMPSAMRGFIVDKVCASF